ncbi:hypothetical protein [Streptomyces albireticuli]|nr:hypothetical protein [Streptomyces albireticuli]
MAQAMFVRRVVRAVVVGVVGVSVSGNRMIVSLVVVAAAGPE